MENGRAAGPARRGITGNLSLGLEINPESIAGNAASPRVVGQATLAVLPSVLSSALLHKISSQNALYLFAGQKVE